MVTKIIKSKSRWNKKVFQTNLLIRFNINRYFAQVLLKKEIGILVEFEIVLYIFLTIIILF